MTGDIRELLPLYPLGLLGTEEMRAVDRAAAIDPTIAAELAAYQDSAAELGGLISEEAPSKELRTRLLASIGGGRFERYSTKLASLFDVSVDRARELLGLIEKPGAWELQIPGIELVHFSGGPAYAAADCGFVRLAPGAMFPPHTHMGDEVTVILSGSVREPATGRVRGPGDEAFEAQGTDHYFFCEGTEPCIYAARAINGIEVAGIRIRPMKR